MRTDKIRACVREIHADAARMANNYTEQARAARVFARSAIAISHEESKAIGEMLIALMAINNTTLDLTDKESERADTASNVADQAHNAALSGMALIAHLRQMKFRELLGWWLRHRARPSHRQVRAS